MTYELGKANLLRNLCIECATILQGKYGHVAWGVKPSADGSMISIQPMSISADPKYAYVFKTREIQQTTDRRRLLIEAGGECLERYKLSRTKQQFESTMPQLSRRGFLIPES